MYRITVFTFKKVSRDNGTKALKRFSSDIVANAYQQESELIARLYAAATDADAMRNFLQDLIRLLNSATCQFVTVEKSGNLSLVKSLREGFDPHHLKEFDEYYCHKNIFNQRVKPFLDSNIQISAFDTRNIVPDEEYLKSEIYNDWTKKQHIRYGAMLPIKLPSTELTLGLNRTYKQGSFTREELRFIDYIAPHLVNVLKIQKKFNTLESEKQQLATGLYHLNRPYLLFDENLKVVFINRQAEAFFQFNHSFSVTDGFFKVKNPSLMSEIDLTLSLAVSTALGQHNQKDRLIKIKRDGRRDIILHISPISMATDTIGMAEKHTACASMEIYDQETISLTSEQTLGSLYSLTPAEAKLAIAIHAGKSLKEIEQETNVRINTLKTHLRAIFRKTDTSRQQELIVKLANLPNNNG